MKRRKARRKGKGERLHIDGKYNHFFSIVIVVCELKNDKVITKKILSRLQH